MIVLKLVWRQMWLRPGRTLLTLAGVTIGVAAVVAMVILQANARRQFAQMRETLSGKGALEIVARSGGRFEAAAAHTAGETSEVACAAPSLRQITTLYAGERKVKALLVGVEPGREAEVRDVELVVGRLAAGPNELVLDADFASSLGVGINQPIKLLTRQLLVRWTVVGLVRFQASPGSGGATALVPLDSLREAFALPGKADLVHVLLKPNADPKAVEAKLAASLPEFLTVRASGAYRTASEQNFDLMDFALRATRVLLVIIAAFISLNTFLMNVGERLPLFAVLRGVGATSRQIAMMLMTEAAVLGVVGSVLGVTLGLLGSRPLIREFQSTLGVGAEELHTPNGLIALGLLLGPLTVVAAAAYPAYRASRVSPLAHVRGTSVTERRLPTSIAHLGAAAVALGLIGLYLTAEGVLPRFFFGTSSGVMVVGAAGVLNLLIAPLTGLATLALRPIPGPEAELARRQVLRNPARTWLTSATLFIAIAATTAIGNALFNVTGAVRSWIDDSFPVDFIVRTMPARLEDATTADLPATMKDEIGRMPGVAWIDPASFVRCAADQKPSMLMVRDYRLYEAPPMELKQGDPAEVRSGLLAGEAVINPALQQTLGVKLGDSIRVETEHGSKTCRVTGVMMEFSFPGNIVSIDRRTAKGLIALDSVDAFLITAAPDRASEVDGVLRAYCDERALMFQTRSSMRARVDRTMSDLTSGLWMLLVLAFVVASFGVFNVMAINVLEQTRELGLMRAVGMEPAQVRRMFVYQGLMLATVGLLPGVVVGVGLGYAINLTIGKLLGFAVAYEPHLGSALGGVAVGAAIVAATSYFLGARAARMGIRDALAQS